ncbi:MAG: zinc ribbon domain-containing protein [Planctomycetota bacterium]|jgi:predicted  nucleic acid-binding Zn-ribbon protein
MTLINSLLQLYQVDAQVRGLRNRLDAAGRYLNAQNAQLKQLEQQQSELQTRKKQTQATIANHEVEIAGIDERIEKLRDELNSAVTNKQYGALLTELNSHKTQRGELEEKVLQEMETVEQRHGHLEDLQKQVVARIKVRDLAADERQEREAEIGERLAELEKERESSTTGIPAEHLAVFDEMADCYDGEAMAQIEEIDRRHRDYACGACHMTLPFEHVSVLLSGGDTLVRCTACSRILYLHEETRGALAKQ